MKSAYELAMERLSKSSPTVKLTDEQKQQIAELEARCKAGIAEREITLKEQMDRAAGQGDLDKMEKLEREFTIERKKLQTELEEKKERVRRGD